MKTENTNKSPFKILINTIYNSHYIYIYIHNLYMIISLNSAFVTVPKMSAIYGRQITNSCPVRLCKSLLLPKQYVTCITWFVCTFSTHTAWDLYSWCCVHVALRNNQFSLSKLQLKLKSIWTFKPHLKRLNVSALENKITEQMGSAAQAFLFTKAHFLHPLVFHLMQWHSWKLKEVFDHATKVK